MIDIQVQNHLKFPQVETEEGSARARTGSMRSPIVTAGDLRCWRSSDRIAMSQILSGTSSWNCCRSTKRTPSWRWARTNMVRSRCSLRRVGFVHALEVVPGLARFAAARCMQEGLSNVEVGCGVDDCRLPYESGKFDGVVLNIVFEWCGSRDPSTDHVESQRRLLGECLRVLKPGGWVYLMTKNRYAMTFLHGVQDTHTFNWRFGSVMPRWLLALLIRLRKKPRPEGMLHSYSALRQLVIDAGFRNPISYWAVPDSAYRFPTEFVQLDAKSIRAARKRPGFVQGSYRKAEIMFRLMPAPLVKHVTSSLTFFAEKPVETV